MKQLKIVLKIVLEKIFYPDNAHDGTSFTSPGEPLLKR